MKFHFIVDMGMTVNVSSKIYEHYVMFDKVFQFG